MNTRMRHRYTVTRPSYFATSLGAAGEETVFLRTEALWAASSMWLYDYVEWDIPRAVAAFPFGSMKALHVYPALKSGVLGARADTCKARCTSAPEAPHVSVLLQ